jgi:hypothetical protein
MPSSPDKCLVQDAFLRPVFEIKSGDASNVADNATTREKISRWNSFTY